ncbi:hypothetical protein DAEQUDRAFT_112190 [Daedalea quercina L-15889]|uniref:Uncharacterized protein n=1 Tax=Daedalea quercina L-15889 TaxID=1314783 RepID=A0A165S5J6_9APHY|nr:hypothetical protein DAEQUDRAFT_112190 [Daedalea quercina L-15889]
MRSDKRGTRPVHGDSGMSTAALSTKTRSQLSSQLCKAPCLACLSATFCDFPPAVVFGRQLDVAPDTCVVARNTVRLHSQFSSVRLRQVGLPCMDPHLRHKCRLAADEDHGSYDTYFACSVSVGLEKAMIAAPKTTGLDWPARTGRWTARFTTRAGSPCTSAPITWPRYARRYDESGSNTRLDCSEIRSLCASSD